MNAAQGQSLQPLILVRVGWGSERLWRNRRGGRGDEVRARGGTEAGMGMAKGSRMCAVRVFVGSGMLRCGVKVMGMCSCSENFDAGCEGVGVGKMQLYARRCGFGGDGTKMAGNALFGEG